MSLKIYLAGPDVFLADAVGVGRRKVAACREFGFTGLFPLDQDEAVGADPARIFRANCALMEKADVGLFNLTPFRGVSVDAGTAFELGFLFARGKRAFGYANIDSTYAERVAQSTRVDVRGGRKWDSQTHAVEDFGLSDNLMIVRSIADSGGVIAVAESRGADDPLAAFEAFRSCLAKIAG